MDSRLTEVLVCPICKGPVVMNEAKDAICCAKCAKAYPIVDEIAVMLEKQARDLTAKEVERYRVKPVP